MRYHPGAELETLRGSTAGESSMTLSSLGSTLPTEFGAEANRSGSADEMGTFEFQTNFMLSQMRILRDVPYLNGYFAWALKDYAVRPEWGGGNPDPSPPYSKKGLFDLFYNPKPAALEVEREFKATAPFK